MAKKKLIKAGDFTFTMPNFNGEPGAIKNRVLSEEATFALGLIDRWGMDPALPPGAVVERAFDIAKLAYQHIKDNRMDVPFPFAKVYPDDQENG